MRITRLYGAAMWNRIKSVRRIFYMLVFRFMASFLRIKVRYCPVCETSSSHFLDYNGRNDVRCYNCNSFERHRLLYLYATQLIRDLITHPPPPPPPPNS